MSRKIFVIGAKSAMARAAIDLLAKDDQVITGGRSGCDIRCDINETVEIPEGTDTVINFAASFGGVADAEVLDAVGTNVLGTIRICLAAKAAGVKQLVLISSMSAVHTPDSPYYSVYAITKRQADELAAYYCEQNDIQLTILRPTQVYGNDEGFAKNQPFFYDIIAKARAGQDITIYGSHDAQRNYIHADDLAEVIRRTIDQRVTGTFACMYPADVSYSKIAHSAQDVFGKGGAVKFLDDKPDIPDNIFTSDVAIYDALGYRPRTTLKDGIAGIKEYQERQL